MAAVLSDALRFADSVSPTFLPDLEASAVACASKPVPSRVRWIAVKMSARALVA
jgi:hypothetical protein